MSVGGRATFTYDWYVDLNDGQGRQAVGSGGTSLEYSFDEHPQGELQEVILVVTDADGVQDEDVVAVDVDSAHEACGGINRAGRGGVR